MISSRYKDTQRNLVFKTLIGLGWAYCSCLPKYVLKVNDDVFVNIRILVNWLFERTNATYTEEKVYTGMVEHSSFIFVHVASLQNIHALLIAKALINAKPLLNYLDHEWVQRSTRKFLIRSRHLLRSD